MGSKNPLIGHRPATALMRMAAPRTSVTIASTPGKPKPQVNSPSIAPSRPRLSLSVLSRATASKSSSHRIGRMGGKSYPK